MSGGEATRSGAEPEDATLVIPSQIFDESMTLTMDVVGWSDDFRIVSVALDIGTHVYELFDTFPLKRFKGAMGTGKTRSEDVDAQLVHEPTRFTSETDAVMFRMAARGVTLII